MESGCCWSRAFARDRVERGASPGRAGSEGLSEQASIQLVSRAVKRAQSGDREALGFLYVRYADNIHGYVRSIVHDEHEAEDVTQQVFAKLMQ